MPGYYYFLMRGLPPELVEGTTVLTSADEAEEAATRLAEKHGEEIAIHRVPANGVEAQPWKTFGAQGRDGNS